MWITQWKPKFGLAWNWWVFGFYFVPGWNFTICLGPLQFEIAKSQTHITPASAFDWTEQDPGTCSTCGQPWELVRPGKSQPTCDC